MNSQKIAGDIKGFSKVGQDANGNFNDVTMSSLKTKYEILEDNFLQLVKAVKDNNLIGFEVGTSLYNIY